MAVVFLTDLVSATTFRVQSDALAVDTADNDIHVFEGTGANSLIKCVN